MNAVQAQRREVQDRLLDLFFKNTGLPISLFDAADGHTSIVTTAASLAKFQPFCRLIQVLPDGAERCKVDQCDRVAAAFRILPNSGGHTRLVMCHAGLWNQEVPILVRGEVRGILVFGEMRVADERHEQASTVRLESALRDLGADEGQSEAIRQARAAVPQLTLENIATYVPALQESLKWFYTLIDEQDHLEIAIERVTHEIQTRMQALLSKAENLVDTFPKLHPREATERALGVLHAVEALNTVLETLGQSLGEYKFKTLQILPLISEAKAIYEDEAAARGIDIIFDLPLVLEAEISKAHFQHAVNNLVHNAVKYSFRTVASGQRRWVRISARAEKNELVLGISNYGVGILPEEIQSESLFELGAKGKLTRGEFRSGSGKGLYFARRVVEGHHGRIEVQSELLAAESSPEGKPHHNRFTLYIPLKQQSGGHHV